MDEIEIIQTNNFFIYPIKLLSAKSKHITM